MKNIKMMVVVVIVFSVALFWSASAVKAYYPTELITNGGFENDPIGINWSSWLYYGGMNYTLQPVGAWTGTTWHGGSRGAKLGTYIGTEFLTQDVSIPANVSKATFSYWYKWTSHETLLGYDALVFDLSNKNDVSDSYCVTVLDPGSQIPNSTWTQVTCDLLPAKGKTLTLVMSVKNDASDATTAYLDDISLVLETPDTTAPTTTVSAGTIDGLNGYYKTIPTITLTASDDTGGGGVTNIQYAWDGGTAQTYTSPLSASQGTHTLTYFATDIAGNREATKSLTLKVDTVLPSTTSSLSIAVPDGTNGYYRSASVVTLLGSDGVDGSGVKQTLFSVDGTAYIAYSSPLTIADGNHTITYYSVDNAGNAESAKTMSVKVDQSGPTLTCASCTTQLSVNEKIAITGQVTDATSGVASLTINGTPVSYDAQGNFSSPRTLTLGDNSFTLLVTDAAGNSTSLQFVINYTPLVKILAVSASKPVMKNGNITASTYSINTLGKKVAIKPFSNYSGKISSKQITFGDTSLYVFVPQDPYAKGAVYVYNDSGKVIQVLKPFGKYVTTGMNVSFSIDNDANTAWLAIGEAKGSKVAVYQITSSGVWLKSTLSQVTTKKNVSISVKWLKVYPSQLGLVTMITGKPATMKTWKLNATAASFIFDSSIKASRFRFPGKDILLR